MPNNRIVCCCCGKQALKETGISRHDPYVTTLEGGRAGFKPNECFCGYCAEEMDEDGLFPEERATFAKG